VVFCTEKGGGFNLRDFTSSLLPAAKHLSPDFLTAGTCGGLAGGLVSLQGVLHCSESKGRLAAPAVSTQRPVASRQWGEAFTVVVRGKLAWGREGITAPRAPGSAVIAWRPKVVAKLFQIMCPSSSLGVSLYLVLLANNGFIFPLNTLPLCCLWQPGIKQ